MIDVTDATFQTDVLEESTRRPVVVDLWAPWCGPCKTLGPLIEKVVAETNGKVLLAKINVDENPQASAAFRVQSIPAVYALSGGQIVDGFTGARPEAELREFVQSIMPSPEASALDALIEAGDEASLLEVLEADPGNARAVVALAELLVADGRNTEALEYLARIPENDDTRRIAALARTGLDAQATKTAEVEVRLAELLPNVKADDAARQEFVDLLEVMGADNPATPAWRKKLTTQLF